MKSIVNTKLKVDLLSAKLLDDKYYEIIVNVEYKGETKKMRFEDDYYGDDDEIIERYIAEEDTIMDLVFDQLYNWKYMKSYEAEK